MIIVIDGAMKHNIFIPIMKKIKNATSFDVAFVYVYDVNF